MTDGRTDRQTDRRMEAIAISQRGDKKDTKNYIPRQGPHTKRIYYSMLKGLKIYIYFFYIWAEELQKALLDLTIPRVNPFISY